jgi:hypothetical protein
MGGVVAMGLQRRLTLAGLVGGWVLAAAGSASAEQIDFTRSPAQGPPGTVIAMQGSGCQEEPGRPYDSVLVTLRSGQPGQPEASEQFPVAGDGTWSGQIVVPRRALAGPWHLRASCMASDMLIVPPHVEPFQVVTSSPSPAPRATASTRPQQSPTSSIVPKIPTPLPSRISRGSSHPTPATVATPTVEPPPAVETSLPSQTTALNYSGDRGALVWIATVLLALLVVLAGGVALHRRRSQAPRRA